MKLILKKTMCVLTSINLEIEISYVVSVHTPLEISVKLGTHMVLDVLLGHPRSQYGHTPAQYPQMECFPLIWAKINPRNYGTITSEKII